MVIKTVEELDKALEILSTSEIIAFDFETMPSGLFPEVDKKEAALHHKMCELEGLALRSEKLDPIYIPISDTEIPRVYLTEKISTLFSQESLFVAHNIQFDAKIADYFFGARPKNKFCTLVGYWYLDENTPKDAKTLGKKHFDIDMIPYDEAKKLGEKDFYDYAKRDAEVTYRLYFFLREALEENHFDLASTLEMNFIDVLIDMTLYGTPCDFKYLKEGERILTNKVLELEAKIYKELGEFNINSPQQLCEKLYGIKIKRKKVNGKFLSTFEKVEDYDSNNYAKVKAITETGAPSTKEEALEKIDTPAAKLLKEYRGIMKLLSTYAIGYQKYVIDNKIYPTFNNSGRDSFQYGTVTGRLSSSAPNMQNISHEPTEGWWLREAIYAKDGYKLIVADEAQLEMRLLAHFSKDPHLIEAIKSGEDIHLATAKIIFGKEEISSEERRFAKTQNFSTTYGQGIIAMANQLGCSKEEAKKFRFKYFDTFPKIKKYVDRVGEKLEQNGYVKTVLGRKRRIPEVYSNESGIVARAKRQGVNSIIQGSAADVLKAAMVKIHSEFKEKNLDAHILLQIHDELVIECKEEQVEEASAIVKEYMEHPLNKDFRVPLEVEPKICKTWAEGKD